MGSLGRGRVRSGSWHTSTSAGSVTGVEHTWTTSTLTSTGPDVPGGRLRSGPMSVVMPLYLNAEETKVLLVAVGLAINMDSEILLGEESAASHTSRGDQVKAAARERLPVLRSLRTALAEHGMALEHTEEIEDEDG